MNRAQKDERFSFRVSTYQKALLSHAALTKGCTMTEFILSAASEAASILILEEAERIVSADSWKKIEEALQRKPKEIKALKEMAQKLSPSRKSEQPLERSSQLEIELPVEQQKSSNFIQEKGVEVRNSAFPHAYRQQTQDLVA